MEFLNETEYIDTILKLKSEFIETYNKLNDIQIQLNDPTLSFETYEKLYETEFKLIVLLSGSYNDLMNKLKSLYKQVPEQRFFVSNLEKELDLYRMWETIEI